MSVGQRPDGPTLARLAEKYPNTARLEFAIEGEPVISREVKRVLEGGQLVDKVMSYSKTRKFTLERAATMSLEDESVRFCPACHQEVKP